MPGSPIRKVKISGRIHCHTTHITAADKRSVDLCVDDSARTHLAYASEPVTDINGPRCIYSNVPRVLSVDVRRSMGRVGEALEDLGVDVPVLQSRISHFKVYQRTLWQSVPVQRVSGRGTRGKGQAVWELDALNREILDRIQTIEEPDDEA